MSCLWLTYLWTSKVEKAEILFHHIGACLPTNKVLTDAENVVSERNLPYMCYRNTHMWWVVCLDASFSIYNCITLGLYIVMNWMVENIIPLLLSFPRLFVRDYFAYLELFRILCFASVSLPRSCSKRNTCGYNVYNLQNSAWYLNKKDRHNNMTYQWKQHNLLLKTQVKRSMWCVGRFYQLVWS